MELALLILFYYLVKIVVRMVIKLEKGLKKNKVYKHGNEKR